VAGEVNVPAIMDSASSEHLDVMEAEGKLIMCSVSMVVLVANGQQPKLLTPPKEQKKSYQLVL
jgi:hypothetical protein